MAKTPNRLLFDFIKSLSGSEKGHFKKMFSKSKSHYLCIRLFDAIVKQKEFDDVALEKIVYKHETGKQHKYTQLKKYTLDQILKSLHGYDEAKSDKLKIRRLFINIEVFYKRGFLKAAKNELKKIQGMAIRNEDFLSQLEGLKWEKEIAWKQNDFAFIEQQIVQIDKKEQVCQAHFRKVSAYRNMFLQMLALIRKGESPQHKIYREKADDIMQHPLLMDVESAQCYHSKVYFYRIHAIYSYTVLDWQKFYFYSKELLEIMNSNTYLRDKNSSEYISAFSNFMISCSMLKRYEEMKTHLVEFKKIKAKSLTDKQKIHQLYYLNNFERCCRTGEFEEGLALLEQHLEEAQLEKIDPSIFETNSFLFYYTYLYFGTGHLKKTADFIYEFNKKSEKELYRLSKIMELIIQVEEESYILLDYTLKNYNYFLKQQKETGSTIFQLEEVIKDFIKAVLKSSDPNALPLAKVYVDFKPKFEALKDQAIEKTLLQYFDIIAWLDSKIEGTSFSDAVKRRYQQARK